MVLVEAEVDCDESRVAHTIVESTDEKLAMERQERMRGMHSLTRDPVLLAISKRGVEW